MQVTFDCADPDRLSRFWAEALHYRFPDAPGGHASWEEALRAFGVPEEDWNSASALEDPDAIGPRLYFQRVPEPKTAKNRLHLDLRTSGGPEVDQVTREQRMDAEARRLEELGATRVELRRNPLVGDLWLVMQDPEGNEFCLT